MNKLDKEFRSSNIEYREEEEKLILEGYAIIWNTETLIGDEARGFYESIDRNAIDPSALKDCCLKYNHDNGTFILARVRNKSLQLTMDDKGLFMRAELQANVQQHRDVYNMVQSGLLDKMSFAFTVKNQIVNRSKDLPSRKITKIGKVFEISIVDIPAYDDTSVYARSLEMVEKEIESLEKEEQRSAMEDVELEKLKAKIRLSLI